MNNSLCTFKFCKVLICSLLHLLNCCCFMLYFFPFFITFFYCCCLWFLLYVHNFVNILKSAIQTKVFIHIKNVLVKLSRNCTYVLYFYFPPIRRGDWTVNCGKCEWKISHLWFVFIFFKYSLKCFCIICVHRWQPWVLFCRNQKVLLHKLQTLLPYTTSTWTCTEQWERHLYQP